MNEASLCSKHDYLMHAILQTLEVSFGILGFVNEYANRMQIECKSSLSISEIFILWRGTLSETDLV